MSDIHSTIIIGSGPSGWTTAIYLARAGLNPVVFAGENSGGQLMLTTEVENFPGFPKGIMGPDLMLGMRQQAERFGAQILDKNITKVEFSAKPFKVWSGESEYQAKSIVVSTGASSVWLGVPGESQFIGRGVSTCAVCDAAFFRDKVTYVVGGGDSAMEDTLALAKFAKEVTVIHRRDSFKASKIMQDRVLAHPKVKVIWNSTIKEIKGDQKVSSIILEDLVSNETKELNADGVFVAIGHKPTTEIFQGQIALDEKGFVLSRLVFGKPTFELAMKAMDEKGMLQYPTMTSVEGVFAAGDCVDFRYKQAITAAAYGCMAAIDAERWLSEQ